MGPGGSGLTLWPNVAFLPKVLPHRHCNQTIYLAWVEPTVVENAARVLYPVRVLAAYIDATATIQKTDQLFVCYGGKNRGLALSRQCVSHWIVDSISRAYGATSFPLPAWVTCHSTRGFSTS